MVKKNTGPQDPLAKVRASRNAISHGISSNIPVVNAFESAEEWEYHLNGVVESLAPEGYLEVSMAWQIAVVMWRMRRVVYHETQVIGWQNEMAEKAVTEAARTVEKTHNVPVAQQPLVEALIQVWTDRILPENEMLDRIKKYEAHLHRLWMQTLHELEALQTHRKGGDAPLARLDISGTRE